MLQAMLQLRNKLSRLVRMVCDNAIRLKAVGFVLVLLAIAMNLSFVNFAVASQFCSGNTFIEPVVNAKFTALTESNSSEQNWGYLMRECLAVKRNRESNEFKREITSTPDKSNLKSEKFLHATRNLVNISVSERNNFELTVQTAKIFDDKNQIDISSELDILSHNLPQTNLDVLLSHQFKTYQLLD